jgi:hypothetical protein
MMVEQQGQDYFTQKRIELMIDVANKKVNSEIQLLRKMVTQLEQELLGLRKQVHLSQQQTKSQVKIQQVAQPTPTMAAQVAPQAPQQATPTQKSTDQPRYGKFTSDDVSIEKFFNFSGGARK